MPGTPETLVGGRPRLPSRLPTPARPLDSPDSGQTHPAAPLPPDQPTAAKPADNRPMPATSKPNSASPRLTRETNWPFRAGFRGPGKPHQSGVPRKPRGLGVYCRPLCPAPFPPRAGAGVSTHKLAGSQQVIRLHLGDRVGRKRSTEVRHLGASRTETHEGSPCFDACR